ncbi:hypothetical protein N431DRAFT_424790 [Stipitochalara longipes BDJ]|nr:hypothetical protein N431DRAFT_424790 [Stipitochalara longipes BDJ]
MDAKLRAMQGPTPAFVMKLQRLPPEIVHQILDCLPLYKVLNLLAHRTPYAAKCVLTHPRLKEAFRSLWDINRILDCFILFRDIRIFCRQSLKDIFVLSLNYSMIGYDNVSNSNLMNVLIDKMIDDIRDHLRLELHDIDLLRSSTDYPPPLDVTFENLLNRWLWIKRAKERMNAAKADQWTKAADLLTAFPTLLKKTRDPSQGEPRINIAHITNRFRGNAKRCLNDRRLVHRRNKPCVPGVDLIELVPYDRYLWLFVNTIQKYPPANDTDALTASFHRLTLNLSEAMGTTLIQEGTTSQVQGESHFYPSYPTDIISSIQTAMDGLFYVYTGSTMLVIPRFRWLTAKGPNFDDNDNVEAPRFFINPKPHRPNLPEDFHRCPVKKQKPFDDREYQWLEAFAKVVTWMQKEFGSGALEAVDC